MPSILLVDDEHEVLRICSEALVRFGLGPVECVADGEAGLARLRGRRYDLCLLDLGMPGMGGMQVLAAARDLHLDTPVVVISGVATREDTVQAMKLGAEDVWFKPLLPRQLVEKVKGVLKDRRRTAPGDEPRQDGTAEPVPVFIGHSEAVQRLLVEVNRAAVTGATVLLVGETGTGKGVLARYIHRRSGRQGPFVAVNCGGLPHGLIEGMLFGHEKGAYTGAHEARVGHFEAANAGTLFLDEVSELPAEAQAALLQAVEEKWVRRLGAQQTVTVDVRLVAATNRDLAVSIQEGRFRQDLYFRLAEFTVKVPSLREHMADFEELVAHFLGKCSGELGREVPQVTTEAAELLRRYDWPGNVRELENVVRRAVILCGSGSIGTEHVTLSGEGSDGSGPVVVKPGLGQRLAELADDERRIISEALKVCGGAVHGPSGAASLLGIAATRLRSRMRKLGLSGTRYPGGAGGDQAG